MYPVIYDVAVSLDGYISGPAGDISKFAHEGPVVEDYSTRLAGYKMALMGRNTYEFGYAYGHEPGQNPYPHMETVVFSDGLHVPQGAAISVCNCPEPGEIRQLARDAAGPIYLCGGGEFAGWMLAHGLIDKLILKRAPCVLGAGVRLFGTNAPATKLSRINTKTYENGYVLEELEVG